MSESKKIRLKDSAEWKELINIISQIQNELDDLQLIVHDLERKQ